MTVAAPNASSVKRIVSVDQLRGFAIFGMLLVNAKGLFFTPVKNALEGSPAFGAFDACLYQISHGKPTYTYADSIAPLFVFVVGMGMRMSWLRRSERAGAAQTRKAMAKRYAMLVLIAFAIYAGWLWDALMDIGLAGLLALFFIDKKPWVRMAAAFAFVIVYQGVFMSTSYGVWSLHKKFSEANPDYVPLLVRLIPLSGELFKTNLNGGLLGPLSWVMMLLFGSYAYDLMHQHSEKKFVLTCIVWGVLLCAVATMLSAKPLDGEEFWGYSPRHMTAPFPLWSTGLCFLQLLAFYILCDKLRINIPTFASVGMNPLALYIAQCLILDVAEGFQPKRLPLFAGLLGFALFWGLFAGAAHYMRRKGIYIKL